MWRCTSACFMGALVCTAASVAPVVVACSENATAVSGKCPQSTVLESVEHVEELRWHVKEAIGNSFAMIIATELGDRTFFIAALLAMRHDRRSVFFGAAGALAAMTALSAAIGLVLPSMLSRRYTHWASTLLFLYFGLKNIYDAVQMVRKGEGVGPSDELDEVEESLKESKPRSVAMQAFMLTFLAEWGDKSQISTIALAANKEAIGVTVGGMAGHCCCTGLAVVGGRLLASRISERIVVACAGVLFLLFTLHGVLVPH